MTKTDRLLLILLKGARSTLSLLPPAGLEPAARRQTLLATSLIEDTIRLRRITCLARGRERRGWPRSQICGFELVALAQ